MAVPSLKRTISRLSMDTWRENAASYQAFLNDFWAEYSAPTLAFMTALAPHRQMSSEHSGPGNGPVLRSQGQAILHPDPLWPLPIVEIKTKNLHGRHRFSLSRAGNSVPIKSLSYTLTHEGAHVLDILASWFMSEEDLQRIDTAIFDAATETCLKVIAQQPDRTQQFAWWMKYHEKAFGFTGEPQGEVNYSFQSRPVIGYPKRVDQDTLDDPLREPLRSFLKQQDIPITTRSVHVLTYGIGLRDYALQHLHTGNYIETRADAFAIAHLDGPNNPFRRLLRPLMNEIMSRPQMQRNVAWQAGNALVCAQAEISASKMSEVLGKPYEQIGTTDIVQFAIGSTKTNRIATRASTPVGRIPSTPSAKETRQFIFSPEGQQFLIDAFTAGQNMGKAIALSRALADPNDKRLFSQAAHREHIRVLIQYVRANTTHGPIAELSHNDFLLLTASPGHIAQLIVGESLGDKTATQKLDDIARVQGVASDILPSSAIDIISADTAVSTVVPPIAMQ